jgi:hypothetical protein
MIFLTVERGNFFLCGCAIARKVGVFRDVSGANHSWVVVVVGDIDGFDSTAFTLLGTDQPDGTDASLSRKLRSRVTSHERQGRKLENRKLGNHFNFDSSFDLNFHFELQLVDGSC